MAQKNTYESLYDLEDDDILDTLHSNLMRLNKEVGAWLNTSDATTGTGIESTINAWLEGNHMLSDEDYFPKPEYLQNNFTLSKDAANAYQMVFTLFESIPIDKLNYYSVADNVDEGYWDYQAYGDLEVESYEEDGLTNDEANEQVNQNMFEVCQPMIEPLIKWSVAIEKAEKLLFYE